jgi:hypothetical protein
MTGQHQAPQAPAPIHTAQELKVAETMAAVATELHGLQTVLKLHMDTSNRRMDDLKDSIDTQLKNHGDRIATLEKNERDTAIRAATAGAAGGGLAAVLIEVVRNVMQHGTR